MVAAGCGGKVVGQEFDGSGFVIDSGSVIAQYQGRSELGTWYGYLFPSIISSSLGDGHRPGMLSRGQER